MWTTTTTCRSTEVMFMNANMTCRQINPLVIQEIQKHKWLESEKRGYDIGNNAAATEWISVHYDKWLQSVLTAGN